MSVCEERLGASVKISAPGKIIFLGEHSVVYGKQAIAFSLGLKTELLFKPEKDAVTLHLPEISIEKSWPLVSIKRLWEKLKSVEKAEASKDLNDEKMDILKNFLQFEKDQQLGKSELGLVAFFHLYVSLLPYPVPFCISVKSEMPVGSGLGSSAAYAVCLTTVLHWLSGKVSPSDLKNHNEGNETLKSICEWALSSEKILHGTPSGIDNAICTYGKAVSFKAGKISILKCPPLRVILVNTKVSRNTKHLVSKVRERYDNLNGIIEPILKSMDNIACSALSILEEISSNCLSEERTKRQVTHLQELVDMNHCLLSGLGVSHIKLERIIFIAKSYGLHAKLTGAGGGGFAFILLNSDSPQSTIDACTHTLHLEGFETWTTTLGNHGVTMANL